jgi:alkaline phosphatase
MRVKRAVFCFGWLIVWIGLVWWGGRLTLAQTEPPPIRNVILFVGDGMGMAHVEAASYFATNTAVGLTMQTAPVQGEMVIISQDAPLDSAAGGTIIATGRRVPNGFVSELPDGTPLETILEHYQARCKSTGLVTTAFLTDATPATFAAHESSRFNYRQIARDYLLETRPRLLFGGGGYQLSPDETTAVGYDVVVDRAGWDALDPVTATRVSAQFADGPFPFVLDGYTDNQPTLSEMTMQALDILADDPDGFFLLVESGRIEDASIANDLERMIPELLALNTAVETALAWAAPRDDTLIVVTADHEAGGLLVTGGNGVGQLPGHTWTTQNNTDEAVPYFIWGEAGVNSVPLNILLHSTVLKKATGPQPSNCDMRLSTAVDNAQPQPVEETVTFGWRVQNEGWWLAQDGVLSATLPALLDVKSISSTQPITATGLLANQQWQLPDLLPGQGLTVTVTAVVTANVPASTTLVPTAVVSGTIGDTPAYIVQDRQGITLTVANIQPITRTDLYYFPSGKAQEIDAPGLLGNDFDLNGDELTAVLSVGPANGQFTLQPNGAFRYQPNPGYAGVEVFQYLAVDPLGAWGIGEVRFYVGDQAYLPLITR